MSSNEYILMLGFAGLYVVGAAGLYYMFKKLEE